MRLGIEQWREIRIGRIEIVVMMITHAWWWALILSLYLGSFYRPPNRKPEIEKEYLEAFNQSLTRIMSNKNAMY